MKKLKIFGFLLLLVALPTILGAAEADDPGKVDEDHVKTIVGKQKPLTLGLGVSRTLEFPFALGSISITQPIFTYTRLPPPGEPIEKARRILITPKEPGATDMQIYDSNGQLKFDYKVRVAREDVGRIITELDNYLGDVEGLQIKPLLDGGIALDGEILLPKDQVRIIRVLNAIKDRDPQKKEIPIRNLTSISKMTMNIIAERIENEIGNPEINVRVINNDLYIEGTADSEFEADRAILLAKTYMPEAVIEQSKGEGSPEVIPKKGGGFLSEPKIIDLLRIRPKAAPPPPQDILITMNYVELKNDYDKSFHFTWKPMSTDNSAIKFDSALGEFSANFVATITSLLPKLNNAKSHGHARILKQSQIVVKNRSEAPAVAESSMQIYTPVTNDRGERSLQAIPVQNFVKVKAATVEGTDIVELGIQIQLSSLVGSEPPQIATNNIQTQITVKSGESAALGGNAINEAVATYNREGGQAGSGQQAQSPGSSLFNMNRSKSFNAIKQQYVIFVTPEVLRSAGAATDSITRKFRLNSGEK